MESRRRRQLLLFSKWASYSLALLLAATLQTMPGFLTVGNVKPLFILPLCMAVACWEGEFTGGLFAAAGGLLWDWLAGRVPGLLSLGLIVLCVAASLVVQLILRVNNMNFTLLTGAGSLFLVSLDFLFSYVMRGYIEPGVEYISRVLPIVIFTTALSPLAMMLAGAIYRRFTPET